MACYRYIEANPVRARMVAEAGDYPWSSFGANALGLGAALVTKHEAYRELGATAQARQAAYRALYDEGLGEDILNAIRDSAQRGWVAGSDRFRRQIAEALGRRVERPVRGRPRKVHEAEALVSEQTSLLL